MKDDPTVIKLVKRKKPVRYHREEYSGAGTPPVKTKKIPRKNTAIKSAPAKTTPPGKMPAEPKKKVVDLAANPPEPQHITIKRDKPTLPKINKVDMPAKIKPSTGRKRVQRLITSRDGHGVGAKKGQSLGNKITRTKDKIKRLVKPYMGKEEYYTHEKGGKKIDKPTYKALRKQIKKSGK